MKSFVRLSGLLLLSAVCGGFRGLAQTAASGPADVVREAKRSLPFHDGALTAAGLREPVQVTRDRYGVPHIYAKNTHDLFFAQGFTAAQDHMWQMEMWRRANEGRLAEVLGKSFIERDKFARLLRYSGDWQKEMTQYHPDGPMILEAFAEGVNCAINVAIEQGKIPVEFQMMKFVPAPSWTSQSLLSRLPAWMLSRNASSELARAIAVRSLGAVKAEEVFPTDPHKKITIPEGLDLDVLSPDALALTRDAGAGFGKLSPLPLKVTAPAGVAQTISPSGGTTAQQALALSLRDFYDLSKVYDLGSNSWVIGGAKSVTGKPILASDPHQIVENPAPQWWVHLVAPGWDVIGATEPGMPGVQYGHNEDVAWASTALGIDQQDLYVEETDPANPDHYFYQGKWMAMEHDRNVIQVLGQRATPLPYTAKRTAHGPVVYEDLAHHRVYALKWIGSEPGAAGFLGALNVLQAKNWADFSAGVSRSWYLPSQSIVYADTGGNYGYLAAGLTPIRANWDGLLPVPGKDGKYEWNGFLPVDKLPHDLNAPRGYYGAANNDSFKKSFPKFKSNLSYEYSAPYRFDRIDEVLRQNKKFSVVEMESLQHDTVSLPARQLLPMLRGLSSNDPAVSTALKQIEQWNGSLESDSIPAALFEAWLLKLTPRVYAAMLPVDQAKAFTRYDLRVTIAWLQAQGKGHVAERNAMVLAALGDGIAWLHANAGGDASQWTWGKVHQAVFAHPLLTPQSQQLLGVPPIARGGDAYTVQATGSPSEDNHDEVHGATAMMVLSTANWDDSVAMNAPGNESAAGSAHSSDLAKMWGEGKYFPLAFTREKVESIAEHHLILAPSPNDEGSAGEVPFKRVLQDTFSHISPVDISWADYDNDGWPDLLVSYVSGALQLFHNDHGKFVDVTASSGLMQFRHRMTAASWGDYDGDGFVDLYVGYAYAPASFNRLYHNDGNGHFTEVSEKMGLTDVGETRQSSFIDFNNDGKLDLYVGFRDHANRLYRNDGDHFTEVSAQMGITGFRSTVGSIWFDLNGDGKLDLIEANQNGALNAVYLNEGDHFVEAAAKLGMDGAPRSSELGSVGLAIADYDNDGKFDIFFANYGPSWLMHNDGDGKYTDVAAQMGVAINAHVVTAGWGDYDNDGLPDLYADGYLSGHEHQEDFLFHNEGGRFRDVLPAMIAKHDGDHATTFVDYDLDGAIDLAMADHETAGTMSLYHNTSQPDQAHRSLELDVVDEKGHRTLPGAEVRLYRSGTREVLGGRLVDTGSAYNSQMVIPLHFGLGKWEGKVDVEVTSMSNEGRRVTRVENVLPSEHVGKPLVIKVVPRQATREVR